MSPSHRLLCTHCTFGGSELEKSSPENAAKVLGYSVRKSSLPDAERGQLRQVFRAIERLLSYSLPKDATAAQKEAIDADSAPRRLIFLPNLGGWQVAGVVSYRAHDTAGRPGSYFADFIVSKAPDSRGRDALLPWSPCDVLALWSAGNDRKTLPNAQWWISSEEQLDALEANGPWKPLPPDSLASLRDDRAPILDDATLSRFLADSLGASDPLVPTRWAAISADDRQGLVAAVLHATIMGPARGGRETITIAAEPSIAAIIFYGVCRLLPRSVAAPVSFSTYEPAPERPLTGLVATTFMNEESPTADLPPELGQRGFACNTYRDVKSFGRGPKPTDRGYARHLVAMATAEDWTAIDALLAMLDADGLTAGDLDRLIEIDRLVEDYFSKHDVSVFHARRGPQETRFLRARFRSAIEKVAESPTSWPPNLLDAAVACLDDDFERVWNESTAVREVLTAHLPPDGEQLSRLLSPPRGQPAAPRFVVAAAIRAALSRSAPPRLPASFVQYCLDASPRPDRKSAVQLLRDVVQFLDQTQQLDILSDPANRPLTELLLDLVVSVEEPLRGRLAALLVPLLTSHLESLANEDPGKAADLLFRHASATEAIPTNRRFQDTLTRLFESLLDRRRAKQVSDLIDSQGRSRVSGLLSWVAGEAETSRLTSEMRTWKTLHNAIRAAVSVVPARPSPQSSRKAASPPEAAAAAIEAILPLDTTNLKPSLNKQINLAATTFKSLKLDAPEHRASLDRVKKSLERAAQQKERALRPPAGGGNRNAASGPPLLVIAMAGTVLLVALIAAIYVAPGWYQSSPTQPVHAAGTEAPNDTAGTNGTERKDKDSDLPANPRPDSRVNPPQITEDDIALELKPHDGDLTVRWDWDDARMKNADVVVEWRSPSDSDKPFTSIKPSADRNATISTAGKGFGDYEVRLVVTLKDGQKIIPSSTFPLPAPKDLLTPNFRVIVIDDKPFLEAETTNPTDPQRYGIATYELHVVGKGITVKGECDSEEKLVRFPIPETITPSALNEMKSILTVAAAFHQGNCEPIAATVSLPPAEKIADELRETLRAQNFIAKQPLPEQFPAAAAETGKPSPLTITNLPWSIDPANLDVRLMTPVLSDKLSLSLERENPADSAGARTCRWKCQAVTNGLRVELGYFEIHANVPWNPSLTFRPPSTHEAGIDACYAALRHCRLAFVISGTREATCQLLEPTIMGHFPFKFATTRQVSKFILPSAPVSNRLLEFAPVTGNGGSFSLTSSTNSTGRQTLVVQREGPSPVAEAEIKFLPRIEPVHGDVLVIDPPVWSSNKDRWSVDKTSVEAEEQRRSTTIIKLTTEIDALTKDLDAVQRGLNKLSAAELAEKQKQLKSKTIARNSAQKQLNECISQVKHIDLALLILQSSFKADSWSISVTTSLSPPAVPDTPDTSDALGDKVVIVRGLAEGQAVQLEKLSLQGPASTDTDKPQ
jgi:hypothetical protein